ncbi:MULTISPECIES: SDR family oxidoreductase [unclassified Variovorax]|uniref:SDR family oxidoreductase n=1 Tax=unclassified Variovorax TaxID=663243 RepID=UPI00083843A3|nr:MULTISPECIES: SDR family oxidoreductase [unclassified Variovorax]
MRIVIAGAGGFLGGTLAAEFARRGHELLCTARNPVAAARGAGWLQARTRWLAVDFDAIPPPSFWLAHLLPGDVVINAAGVLREGRPGAFAAVHLEGPARLFDACAAAGVAFVVQISALGATEEAATGYHRSKAAADAYLRGLPLASAIVQPSLVWGDEGASARLFAALAVLPVLALPGGGRQAVQPVHIEDLVAGVAALVAQRPSGTRTLAFVGPCALAFNDYLHELRSQLGQGRRQLVVPLPESIFLHMAKLAGHWRQSFLDGDTARMLLAGNVAAPDEFAALLGRPPRAPGHFVAPAQAEAMRRASWLAWMLPALRLAIAFVWIWTFIVSIGLYPRDQSLDLLARVGIEGGWAQLALVGAAFFDLALGIATLLVGARGRARWLWPSQLALIAFYTAAISIAMPEFWLHPFGPLSKNLPMCAAILLLWALDSGRGAARR